MPLLLQSFPPSFPSLLPAHSQRPCCRPSSSPVPLPAHPKLGPNQINNQEPVCKHLAGEPGKLDPRLERRGEPASRPPFWVGGEKNGWSGGASLRWAPRHLTRAGSYAGKGHGMGSSRERAALRRCPGLRPRTPEPTELAEAGDSPGCQES